MTLSFLDFTKISEIMSLDQITFPKESYDGRVNSIFDEKQIITLLETKFSKIHQIEKPKIRQWYDIKIDDTPIQIKSSFFKTADNFNSKLGILWALTDFSENDILKAQSWKKFEELLLLNNKQPNHRDFFILVYNKNNHSFVANSLKSLEFLTPNGNNLPFQINWSRNDKPKNNDYLSSYNIIISAYKRSVEKKIKSHPRYTEL